LGLTVRDATFDFLRRRQLTDIFSNPGSTEIPFLTGLPDDLNFVLGLHEGSVVSMASGYALARRRPSFALLHTTPGFGNAVNAIATARVNRTPLVIAIGQQDRRHIAFEPFLAGRLDGLAGDYPVWVSEPARAQDVPGALDRAYHEAETHHGPAIVIVPMGDWLEDAGEPHETAAPQRVLRPGAVDEESVAALAELLDRSLRPALVAGARLDTPERWAALVALAERLGAPVYQEPFSGQAGFPQDHPQWAGPLPFLRPQLRDTLEPYDVVLAVGAPVFRQSSYEPGPFVREGTALAVVSDDADEVHRSPAELAILAAPDLVCTALAARLAQRTAPEQSFFQRPEAPAAGPPLKAAHVLHALGDRLPVDAVVVEECPSNRDELMVRMPARQPLGMVSPAMGGLGWALPASVGLRMGLPDRPVVAVLGDGSTVFGIQGLWSAARYGIGPLLVVLKNGGYRIMDQLAARQGGPPAWPSFGAVDLASIAEAFGCEARRIADGDGLEATFDEVLPGLRERQAPLLLEVTVQPD
jgi:benzoylformate decarboxylase